MVQAAVNVFKPQSSEKKIQQKSSFCRTNNMNRLKRRILKIKTSLPTYNPNKTNKKTLKKRVSKTRALCALYYCDKKIREKKQCLNKNHLLKNFQLPALHFNAKIKKITNFSIEHLLPPQ